EHSTWTPALHASATLVSPPSARNAPSNGLHSLLAQDLLQVVLLHLATRCLRQFFHEEQTRRPHVLRHHGVDVRAQLAFRDGWRTGRDDERHDVLLATLVRPHPKGRRHPNARVRAQQRLHFERRDVLTSHATEIAHAIDPLIGALLFIQNP